MKCTNIYFSRHGVRPQQTPAGFPLDSEPYTGSGYDAPLSPLGRQQAEALGESLAEASIDHIFCSPFRRTIETVAPLARRLGLPIKLEWGLCEFLKAEWFESFPLLPTPEEHYAQFPEIDLIYQSLVMPRYPEDDESLQDRITETAMALTQNFGPSIFLMGHGASSLGIRRILLGDDVPLIADFCAVSQLSLKEGYWQSVLEGKSDHLKQCGIHVRA